MYTSPLGRTLVIANPAAHSGRGAHGARFAETFLRSYASATRGFEVRLTAGPRDAEGIAAASAREGFDTVLALGGDGVIGETANGLISIPVGERPRLGVIPLGSGNDYAHTLGLARNDVEAALAQLVRGEVRRLDVAHVRCSGGSLGGLVRKRFAVQTLSFGLDAAIAIDTTRRRAANTSQEGEALFTTSAVRILAGARRGWACTARFDGGAPMELPNLIFAVQTGPTYGGGFKICPDADPADGLLDVLYNVRKPSTPHILALLGLARSGRHVGSRVVELARVRRVEIEFTEEPPAQVDGEQAFGTRFEVKCVPGALEVIVPAGSPLAGGAHA